MRGKPYLSFVGSSPHVRGNISISPDRHIQYRFIPARAGEHFRVDTLRQPLRRFIPARAGNITKGRIIADSPAVHPRTCGEHIAAAPAAPSVLRFIPARAGNIRTKFLAMSVLGSSPHVRGTFLNISWKGFFIGSSPHVRGTSTQKLVARISNGSSPHVRGTYLSSFQLITHHRFIPHVRGTCPELGLKFRTVHPRTCGEHPA